MIDSAQLSKFLTNVYGLSVLVEGGDVSEGYLLTLSPADIESTITFKVEVLLGWRSLEAKLIFGEYAASLLGSMETASPDQFAAFSASIDSMQSRGGVVKIVLNGSIVDLHLSQNWPKGWGSFEFSMRKGAIVIDPNNKIETCNIVFPWVSRYFGAVLALLPLEEIEPANIYPRVEEGAEFEAKTKRYERNRVNRALCIETHGLHCKVCNLKFSEQYGELGEGFIHIHHIIPVSMMGGAYIIDPINDLVPVCPNCHSMLHKRNPPFTVEQLQLIMTAASK